MTIDYQAWLEGSESQRVVLVEAHYGGGVEYFASSPYISHATDTPANQPYDDILLSMGDIESRIDRTVDIGALVLDNTGDLDDWISRAWQGHSLKIWLGDRTWPLSDFRLEVDGINGGISAPRSNRIEFNFYDQSEKLNKPIQSSLLADNNPVPISLGLCFNVEASYIDQALLVYQVHDGPVESITVRDNGIAVAPASLDLANGQFTLAAPAAGKITCDVVQQDKTAAEIVTNLANRVGVSTLNSASLSAFPAVELGYHASSEVNADQAIAEVLASLGGYSRFNELSELEIHQVLTSGTSALTITEDEIILRGLKLKSTEQPNSEVIFSYGRNWSPQDKDSLAETVSDANKELFSAEYSKVTAINSVSDFPHAKPLEIKSLIAHQVDAQAECDRRAGRRSVKREVWELNCFLPALSVRKGQWITLRHPRHGFDYGQECLVLGIRKNYLRRRVTLEVYV